MSQTVLAVFGISSAVVNTIGLVPYVRAILAHKTKPERATWWIWLALNVIAFSAMLAAGSTWALFMVGGQTLAVVIIAFLSLSYGYGTFKKKDLFALIIAMFGLVLWKFTNSPLTALMIVVAVDALGYWLTLKKTWQVPYTEHLIAWVLAGFAGTLGVMAVGKINFSQLLYPIYVMFGNWLLVVVIIYRRKAASIK